MTDLAANTADPNREKIAPLLVLDDPATCQGTVTLLSPALAVTGRHVISDILGVEDVWEWSRVTAPQMAVAAWSVSAPGPRQSRVSAGQ